MNQQHPQPQVAVGLRAKFFHPKTLGVMHWGKVTKVYPDGSCQVKFDIDGKSYRVPTDHNP